MQQCCVDAENEVEYRSRRDHVSKRMKQFIKSMTHAVIRLGGQDFPGGYAISGITARETCAGNNSLSPSSKEQRVGENSSRPWSGKWIPFDSPPLKETIAEVEARRQEDPWPDSVLRYMEQNSPCSMNEILRHGVSKETEDQTIGDQRRCGAILRQHGYERSQDTSDGRPRMWRKRGAECHRRVRANAMERMHEGIIREDSLWQNASNTDLLKKGWRRLPPRKKKRAYEPGDYIREHVLHLFMCYLKRPFWDRPPYPGDPTKPS